MSRPMTLKNLTIGTVLAQDEPATASHPAHIHAGTCDELDPNPIGPMNNIVPQVNEDSDDENANSPRGVLTAAPVLYSLSDEIELQFEDDVLATSHSINVHERDENIQNYVACGEIGGMLVDGKLSVSLRSMNDSGYSGIAVLTADGNGEIDVEVYLAEPVVAAENVPDVTPTVEPTSEPTVVITGTEGVSAGEATARATAEAGD